jgi:methionyl-tRNA synthetase
MILVCYRISQDLFLRLYENGFLSKELVEQLLCKNCNRYLADRFVEGTCPRCSYEDARGDQCDGCGHLVNATDLISPRCKICQTRPVVATSCQFFLDLPKVSISVFEVTECVFTFELSFVILVLFLHAVQFR